MIVAALMAAVLSLVPGVQAQNGGAASPAPANGNTAVRAGYLTCHVASGWGFIFGSSRRVKCAFSMSGSSQKYTEYYTGSIAKFGADIGYMESAVMLWTVVSPTTNLGKGSLAGHYGVARASVARGVGGGANVLVGGFKHSIALQPVSIQGETGLNVAAGVMELNLKFDKRKALKSTSGQ
jgi:Protein of unknown function (DUF992)